MSPLLIIKSSVRRAGLDVDMPPIQVLKALDQARTQYYHFKAIVIASIGLFADVYDIFCITPVMKVIGRVGYAPACADDSGGGVRLPGILPSAVLSAVVGVALLGAVAGYLAFGALGDRTGP